MVSRTGRGVCSAIPDLAPMIFVTSFWRRHVHIRGADSIGWWRRLNLRANRRLTGDGRGMDEITIIGHRSANTTSRTFKQLEPRRACCVE